MCLLKQNILKNAEHCFRKQIANDEQIPAFAAFTDKELSEIVKLDEITENKMLSIKGIGKKKVEKYGKDFIKAYKTDNSNIKDK